jgi:hypothetical protein
MIQRNYQVAHVHHMHHHQKPLVLLSTDAALLIMLGVALGVILVAAFI